MKVAILPMDDRPVTYDYPVMLARAAGLEAVLPRRDWLGNPWRSSRHADLIAWLSQAASEADACIVSIDTLAYGGLIPSRTSPELLADVLQRLEVLRELKRSRPNLQILASSVVLRICRANSSEEEKPYWATYGSRMFRLSYLEHKCSLGDASPAETAECALRRSEIPDDVYADYLAGRERNHGINLAMLAWLEEGVFDYLLLPQDDTADYGWNIREARRLQARIRERGLGHRAITYPGADEIGSLLLARIACRRAGFAPKVWPRYSGVTGASVITAYEDRPFQELLKAHLAPLNGVIADSPEQADLELHVNAPVSRQGNGDSQWLLWKGLETLRAEMPARCLAWFDDFVGTEGFRATRREIESSARSPEEFVRGVLRALGEGKRPVAIADVAYVNGADLQLGNLLARHREIAGLASFGGWNTAGNTLGTVLAQSLIRVLALRAGPTSGQDRAHFEFLFMRFLDDDAYQARERTRCMLETLPALGLTPTMERVPDELLPQVEAAVGEHLGRAAGELAALFTASGLVREVSVTAVHLPWKRLFEVGFQTRVTLK